MVIVNDPDYLTEPFVRTTDFIYDAHQEIAPYPCESVIEVPRPRGTVPNHLPGDNKFLSEFATREKVPFAGHSRRRRNHVSRVPADDEDVSANPDVAAIVAATDAPPPAEKNGPQNEMVNDGEVHAQHVQGNVYMLSGAGGNITLQVGKEGVLVVDTGLSDMTDKVVAAIRKISDGPIRYMVNTHVHPDHTGGNEKIAGLGSTIVGGNVTGDIADAGKGAAVIAHQTLLDRMSAKDGNQPAYPSGAWPTDTYDDEKDLFFDGEGIQVMHQPAAHTDGDSFVFFRRSDVVSAGDIFVTTGYPIIDLARGGSLQGIIDALNRLIAITIPGRQAGRRHHGDSGPRPALRSGRRGVLPRDGHHPARPHPRHDQEGHDAGAGEGRPSHARLRPGVRIDQGLLDHRHVRGSGVQEPGREVRERHTDSFGGQLWVINPSPPKNQSGSINGTISVWRRVHAGGASR